MAKTIAARALGPVLLLLIRRSCKVEPDARKVPEKLGSGVRKARKLDA